MRQSGNKQSKSIATHVALFVAFGTALKAFDLRININKGRE
jgi:hypothetical protein